MSTNTNQEVWKNIGNGYSISDAGTLTRNGVAVAPKFINKQVTYTATLLVGGKKRCKRYTAAKLLVHAFKNVPLTKWVRLEMKDGDPYNLSLQNVVEQQKGRVGVNTHIAPNKVYKFDTNGELVKTYHSAYAAGIAEDLAHCLVSSVALSGNPIRNAFFRYSDVFDKADLARINPKAPIRTVRSRRSNMLYSYDEKGKFVRSFYTPADAKAFLKIDDISHIYKSINGKRANAFGYMWSKRFYSNIITHWQQQFNIVAKDTNGATLWTEPSYEAAAKRMGVRIGVIHNAASKYRLDGKAYLDRFIFVKESKYQH